MTKPQEIQELEALNEQMNEIVEPVRPIKYTTPTNEEEQKNTFLSGQVQNPNFTYPTLEYDPISVYAALSKLKIPDTPLGRVLEKSRKNSLLENIIVSNRGNQAVTRASIEINGRPGKTLVEYAERLLSSQQKAAKSAKEISASRMKEALERSLHEYGLTDWSVEFRRKWQTGTVPRDQKIYLCETRTFSSAELGRLPVHEIGIHVLRAVNGEQQPLRMFSTGLPEYLTTEEGLTSFFEELTGNSDAELLRNYAGRVIAVDSVCQGLDFRTTYEKLRTYELDEETSWNLALRAHRGGGYIKDHVYLQGHQMVSRFVQNSGDVKGLYIGKIGIDDLPLVNELLNEGFLKQPKILPRFLTQDKE